ncbi:hypothetical protein HYV80_04905 [Candidatus Woesearchaeota archaeon]|nr:hypothetical protein [Candidatus Woesearchaeota archaeon]
MQPKVICNMSWPYFKILPIAEVEKAFGSRYSPSEFGAGAYVVKVTNLEPPTNPLLVSTIGSAGDNGKLKEDFRVYSKFFEAHGLAFAMYADERPDLGLVHVTGGPPGIPALINEIAKKNNPNIFSLAFYPEFSREELADLAEGKLPVHLNLYDWIVVCKMPPMTRGVFVGRSHVNRVYQGAEGSLLEAAEASHSGKVIVAVPTGKLGISNKVEEILALSYTDRGSVVLTEKDPDLAIRRPIAEYFADIRRKRGEHLTNLDVYKKGDGDGRIYLNPRDSPRVTTQSYGHLRLIQQLVLASSDPAIRDVMVNHFIHNLGLNGGLKQVQLLPGEEPTVLRAHPHLEAVIANEILRMVKGRSDQYKVVSHSYEVPVH